MHKVLSLVFAAGLLSVSMLAVSSSSHAQATAAESKSAEVHAGSELFSHNCMQCHTFIEGQVSFGPNLNGELKKPHPRKTPAEIKQILTNGKGKMPSFKEKLTEKNMDELIAYIKTL